MTDEEEEAKRARMIEILRAHGMKISISGCGCCDSPSVVFAYNGEEIVDAGFFCVEMFSDD